MHLFYGIVLFTLVHIIGWWCTNAQFIEGWSEKQALLLGIALSIPTTIVAFFGSKYVYSALGGELWSVRFVAFGLSWLVFPILTWFLLGESMFTTKTIICTLLSFLIIYIQVWC